MEGTYDMVMPYKIISSSLLNHMTSDGVFTEMQIISYSFVILKHFLKDQFTISKDSDAEIRIVIYVGTIGIV